MLTIAETRRLRLEQLIEERGGKIANLNEDLGYERNDTRLARIRNANERKDRPGKVFQMGDPQAREIEEKLGLERGWMDTPPGSELLQDPVFMELQRVAQSLPPLQLQQLIAIGATLGRKPEQPTAASQPGDIVQPETGAGGSTASEGLTAVRPPNPKKIGKGHFGPPAEGTSGGTRGRGNKPGEARQKRNAGGGR